MGTHIEINEQILSYPFVVVSACENEANNWYVASSTRDAAMATHRQVRAQFAKPLYVIVAKFDTQKLRHDLNLLRMKPASEAVH